MGAPNNASLLYVLNLNREAFRFSNFGNASAQAVLLFIVILGITFILFKISRRYVYYEGETSK
jgi:multiple sugar transport system permease protein